MASQARTGPLGAGRDFVAATCRRGRKTFVLMTIRISRRAETRSDRTRRLREHPFRRGVKPSQKWGKPIRRLSESPATVGRTSFANPSYYGARQIVRCNTVLTVFGGVGGIMVV